MHFYNNSLITHLADEYIHLSPDHSSLWLYSQRSPWMFIPAFLCLFIFIFLREESYVNWERYTLRCTGTYTCIVVVRMPYNIHVHRQGRIYPTVNQGYRGKKKCIEEHFFLFINLLGKIEQRNYLGLYIQGRIGEFFRPRKYESNRSMQHMQYSPLPQTKKLFCLNFKFVWFHS